MILFPPFMRSSMKNESDGTPQISEPRVSLAANSAAFTPLPMTQNLDTSNMHKYN